MTKDTEFNEVNVLDGSFASKTFQIGVRKVKMHQFQLVQ